jgi:hypothetical protein
MIETQIKLYQIALAGGRIYDVSDGGKIEIGGVVSFPD